MVRPVSTLLAESHLRIRCIQGLSVSDGENRNISENDRLEDCLNETKEKRSQKEQPPILHVQFMILQNV